MSEWIKCSERMPQSYMPVVVKTLCGRTGIMLRGFHWVKCKGFEPFKVSDVPGDVITHWKMLPTDTSQ